MTHWFGMEEPGVVNGNSFLFPNPFLLPSRPWTPRVTCRVCHGPYVIYEVFTDFLLILPPPRLFYPFPVSLSPLLFLPS